MGELNKQFKRAKQEIACLHYKDEKIFPFKIYVTMLMENFHVLEKDKNKDLTSKQQVNIFLCGIRSTDDTSIQSATFSNISAGIVTRLQSFCPA